MLKYCVVRSIFWRVLLLSIGPIVLSGHRESSIPFLYRRYESCKPFSVGPSIVVSSWLVAAAGALGNNILARWPIQLFPSSYKKYASVVVVALVCIIVGPRPLEPPPESCWGNTLVVFVKLSAPSSSRVVGVSLSHSCNKALHLLYGLVARRSSLLLRS